MPDRTYLQGRCVASSPADAEDAIRQRAREMGHEAVEVKVWASLIQPWETVWWEFLCRLESEDEDDVTR